MTVVRKTAFQRRLIAFANHAPATVTLQPDLLYYQHVMICLNKGRLWAESLRVYDDMCNSDIAPNAAVYFAALSACRYVHFELYGVVIFTVSNTLKVL